jgi:endonuclease/exonuclease/phosphatase family metal-dependent hydrolase
MMKMGSQANGGCKSGGTVGGRRLAALAVIALGIACANAHNYLDPDGPRYTGGPGPRVDAPIGRELRVVTFNVEYGQRIEEAIAALGVPELRRADVIALQAMDAPGVASIAERLGMNYVYYPASRPAKKRRDFGNAILSPWAIESSRKVLLPGRSRGAEQARAAVYATVRIGAYGIGVYSVHLTSPFGMGGGGRARQADAVIADAEALAIPVVVAGDFNSGSVGQSFAARGFTWITRSVGHTVGPFSFDHIFVRSLRLADPASVGVAKGGPRASDHWPVWGLLVDDRASASPPAAP